MGSGQCHRHGLCTLSLYLSFLICVMETVGPRSKCGHEGKTLSCFLTPALPAARARVGYFSSAPGCIKLLSRSVCFLRPKDKI